MTHMCATETRFLVTFKHESYDTDGMPVGPVRVIDVDAAELDPNLNMSGGGIGMPYGYEPPSVEDRGWLRRDKAEAIAQEFGVEVQER
jgi:hypothetical protein